MYHLLLYIRKIRLTLSRLLIDRIKSIIFSVFMKKVRGVEALPSIILLCGLFKEPRNYFIEKVLKVYKHSILKVLFDFIVLIRGWREPKRKISSLMHYLLESFLRETSH
jgi:hypothetical protein